MICYSLKFYFDDAKILYGPLSDKTCLPGFQQMRLKPVFSTTETSQKIGISLVASLDMLLFEKRIIKALFRCAGWLAPETGFLWLRPICYFYRHINIPQKQTCESSLIETYCFYPFRIL